MELTKLKGIGEARKKSFEKGNIFSCEDLIDYFPYKYYDFSKTEPFADDGNVRLIKATIVENPKLIRARKNLTFVTCKASDELGHIFSAVWFNQTYVKSSIYLGQCVYLYGKNSPKKKNTFNVLMFKSENKLKTNGLLPVYHSIDGVGQATINQTIAQALQIIEKESIIPEDILLKHNLINLNESYKIVHNPEDNQSLEQAKERIEIEKLVPMLIQNENNKILAKDERVNYYKNITKLFNDYIKLLPFTLTADQNKAINEITKDLESNHTLNRLLQGDVGSGKTVVAFFCSFVAAKNGYQSAIIAPTEILAKQHYELMKKLFHNENITINLLTNSLSSLEKKVAIQNIKNGTSQIVIGTHSLLSDNIEFKNLSFAVIDEQHRFGVNQRATLKQKGRSVDVLVMSATPIPRSLALVIFGDLDISTINSRPKENNIQTHIVIRSKQHDMWNYLKEKTQNNSKIYVICAKIDEENENNSTIQYSAKNFFEQLLAIFKEEGVGLIHGKQTKIQQDKILNEFKIGTIHVLVSTTIVEVGVDIPDADMMVIVTPERFGLATLHQLRGRIGRNGEEAHCFCLADNLNNNSLDRIKYFSSHLNGFDIAEYDLKTRGAGTHYGTSQHGADSGVISNFTSSAFEKTKSVVEDLKKDKKNINYILNLNLDNHLSNCNIILN